MSAKRRPARRQHAKEMPSEGHWSEALAVLARHLPHGKSGAIHRPDCPANSTAGRCDCACVVVGPAVRGVWQ